MLHILLVDDNPGDVMLVEHALSVQPFLYDLHVLKDGEEALRFISEIGATGRPCPGVLLLDLNLPKVDGIQVLTAFRKRSDCAATPVIVVTSSDAQRDRKQAAELRVTRYFKKPSDYDAFMKLGDLVNEVAVQ